MCFVLILILHINSIYNMFKTRLIRLDLIPYILYYYNGNKLNTHNYLDNIFKTAID